MSRARNVRSVPTVLPASGALRGLLHELPHVVQHLLLGLAERETGVELLEQAGAGVHARDEVVHLLQRRGGRLDDQVDAVAEDVELVVGDEGRHLDEGVVLQREAGHLAVDPHQLVVHVEPTLVPGAFGAGFDDGSVVGSTQA